MPDNKDFAVEFGNRTDPGKVRRGNEDYMECFKSSFGDVFVVCDGMGGHEGGEIASRLAVTTIKQIITTNPNNLSGTPSIIEESISLANKSIILKAEENPSLSGMGTTCVILIIKDHKAYYGHVGDSRMYLLRQDTLYQMTRDHSFVQGLVDQGLLRWDEAENHPRKNEITKALGIFEKTDPEVNHKPLDVYKGDKFLLCSDGLTGPVQENEIKELLSKFNVIEASHALVEKANANGGPDNITVQIVEVIKGKALPQDEIPEGAIERHRQSKIKTGELPALNGIPLAVPVKRNKFLIPGIIVICGLLIILVFVFWNPFKGMKTLVNNIDTTKIKDTSIVRDSTAVLIENFKTQVQQLYRGNQTPENFAFSGNVTVSRDFYYKGKNDKTEKTYSLDKLIKNIRDNDLLFIRVTTPVKSDSINFRCELDVKFKEMTNTYEIGLAVTTDKKLELRRIIFLKEVNMADEEKKKEIPPKKFEQQPSPDKKGDSVNKFEQPEEKKDDSIKEKKKMKKRKIYNMKIAVIISGIILICSGAYSQNPSNVYDEAVKSCAIVTDQSESGIASGFFINNNIFITNRHVTKHIGRSSIVIKTKNGEEFTVKKIIKEYSKSDIAILETEGSSPSFLKLSNTESIKTGGKVFAIGNPTSADYKVYDFNFTEGIINTITYEDINSENLKISAKVIVHSASLNPGNSGGPLINERGEVIGINAFVKGGMAGNYFCAIHLEELQKALDENNIPYIISEGDSSKKYITKNTDSTKMRLDTGIVKRDSISFGKDSLSLKTVNVKSDDSYYLIIGLAAIGGLALIMIPVIISRRRRPNTMQRQMYTPPRLLFPKSLYRSH